MTRPIYNALVAQFRIHGPRFKLIGDEIGIHHATARRAWFTGWEPFSLPAIKSIIEDEQNDARAAIRDANEQRAEADVAKRQALLERARAQAVDARLEESLVVQTVRREVLSCATALAPAYRAAHVIATRMEVLAKEEKYDMRTAATSLRALATATRTLAGAVLDIQAADRALLGTGPGPGKGDDAEPVGSEALQDLTVAAEECRAHAEILQRQATRLRLIDGGKPDTTR